LVKDAQRHGIQVFPIDINHSGWMCRWENGGVRLGLRFVKGLREATAKRIEAAQPFVSADDLAHRAQVRNDQLTKLAYAGALGSLGLTRRAALWQASKAAKAAGELFEAGSRELGAGSKASPGSLLQAPNFPSPGSPSPDSPSPGSPLQAPNSPLPEMSTAENTLADYAAMEMTAGPHLLEHFRDRLRRENVLSAADLKRVPNGSRVATAGAVIVRQRPGTAKGFVFLTLEDETGLSQAIVNPPLFAEYRNVILRSSGLIVEGIVQNSEGQSSVRAEKFWPLDGLHDVRSHDFH
ncbi:MAG TPA: OB-fold nucleic acid binding domain-containing protein, partial [Thermoanaerobaculia bacterium]